MLWMRSVTDALVSDDDIPTMVRAPPGHGPVLATDRLVVARLSLGGDDSAGSKADDGTCSNRATMTVLGMSFVRGNGDGSGCHGGDCDGGYCKLAKHDGSFQLLNSGFRCAADELNVGAACYVGCDCDHAASLSLVCDGACWENVGDLGSHK